LAGEPDPPTTVRDPARAVDEHIADSLSGLEAGALRLAGRVADIGAGAGFPGLPLAIALPSASLDLVESAARKCDVIVRLAGRAQIAAAVHRARAEELAGGAGREVYDAVTVRALAPLAVLLEYASPLLGEGGALIAWKGARDAAEEAAAAAAGAQTAMEPVEVLAVEPFPGAHSRHLHVWRKAGTTPPGLPRRPGMARKRPLG